MTTKKLAQSYLDLEQGISNLLPFAPYDYTAGPSKALHRGSKVLFLDGLMRHSRKKANVSQVTQGLNAAALYGYVSIKGAPNLVKGLSLIYNQITSDSIEICESAASFTLLACELNEYEALDTDSSIYLRLARLERKLLQTMYEHLEIARRV
jgi:hypothetical protein